MDWVKDGVQQGLYIRDRGGKKSWVVRARVKGGGPITYTIGSCDLFSPTEARRETRVILTQLGDELLMPFGNPCEILKIKKQRKALKPRERFLDLDQRVALEEYIGSIESPGYSGSVTNTEAGLVWLLIHTGLRLDEARLLSWGNVDLESKTFSVENTKNGRTHLLPMTSRVFHLLNSLKCGSLSRWVFPSPINPDQPISASRTFEKLSREIKFEFTAHDLRRTVATVATECGYDLEAVGAILNHAKKGVTARYTQRTRNHVLEILQKIENTLFEVSV